MSGSQNVTFWLKLHHFGTPKTTVWHPISIPDVLFSGTPCICTILARAENGSEIVHLGSEKGVKNRVFWQIWPKPLLSAKQSGQIGQKTRILLDFLVIFRDFWQNGSGNACLSGINWPNWPEWPKPAIYAKMASF